MTLRCTRINLSFPPPASPLPLGVRVRGVTGSWFCEGVVFVLKEEREHPDKLQEVLDTLDLHGQPAVVLPEGPERVLKLL